MHKVIVAIYVDECFGILRRKILAEIDEICQEKYAIICTWNARKCIWINQAVVGARQCGREGGWVYDCAFFSSVEAPLCITILGAVAPVFPIFPQVSF